MHHCVTHNKNVALTPGLNTTADWDLSVKSLHLLPVPVWVSSGSSSFFGLQD